MYVETRLRKEEGKQEEGKLKKKKTKQNKCLKGSNFGLLVYGTNLQVYSFQFRGQEAPGEG